MVIGVPHSVLSHGYPVIAVSAAPELEPPPKADDLVYTEPAHHPFHL